MNGTNHLITFIFTWILILIWRLFINDVNWSIMKGLWFGFVATHPDWDIIIQKVVQKLFKVTLHRWFLTHSILFPLILYWLVRDYIIIDNILTKEFVLCLFLPCLIHLLADFNVARLLNENNSDTGGTWQISIFPLINVFSDRKNSHRLGAWGSWIFMIVNVILVGSYCGLIYFT